MAKALKVGVCDLGTEFSAHTFIFGGTFHSAGAVAARHQKPLADGFYNLTVRVFFDFHNTFTVLLIFCLG